MNWILKHMHIHRRDTGRPDKSGRQIWRIYYPLPSDNDLIMFTLTIEPGSDFNGLGADRLHFTTTLQSVVNQFIFRFPAL